VAIFATLALCEAVGEKGDDARFPWENASDIEPLLDAEAFWILRCFIGFMPRITRKKGI